jgi:hypothetical protein
MNDVPEYVMYSMARWFETDEAIVLTLQAPAPSRGGVDAWTWVENGHSWQEVIGQYQHIFESQVGP